MKMTIAHFKNSPPRLIILLGLAFIVLPFTIKSDASGQRRRPMVRDSGANNGLVFRLSEAQDEQGRQGQAQTQQRTARPATEPLSGEAAENLLRRLPPIKVE